MAATTSATARHDTVSIHHSALVHRSISTAPVPGVSTGASQLKDQQSRYETIRIIVVGARDRVDTYAQG